MSVQHDATVQQMRERVMTGAGSSDEVRRENAQLRAQVLNRKKEKSKNRKIENRKSKNRKQTKKQSVKRKE
jgi:hypothetical protein